MSNPSVTSKMKADNTPNEKYVDMLDEDKSLAGQAFVCMSFVSPENHIKKFEEFQFSKFVSQWDLTRSLKCFDGFVKFMAFKYKMEFESLQTDFNDFCKSEIENIKSSSSLNDDFKNFVDSNEGKLSNEFNKQHNFQTSIRGVKVRGSFPTQEEAELRCKMLRNVDPNHDVYVGPVGMWMPFDPVAYKTGRVEYMEEELNQLMHEKHKNETNAKQEFDKRVLESKIAAIDNNRKLASESGNMLSQTIDKDGNLVNLSASGNTNNTDCNQSIDDLRKTLFEGGDIVTDKNNDHGLSRVQSVRATNM